MKLFTIITLALILISEKGKSQYQITPSIRSHAVLLESKLGSGSAFCVTDSPFLYLVTAYHVLFNLKNNFLVSDSLTVISYREDVEKDRKDSFKLSLTEAIIQKQIKVDAKNDIAVIKLAELVQIDTSGNAILKYPTYVHKTGVGTRLNGWFLDDCSNLADVQSGCDIYVIGYPRSLGLQGRFDLDRPLFRKGIVAGKDFSYKRIIGDGAVYFGNSGGAVFGLVFNIVKQDFSFKLIGLVSEYIPYNDILYDSQMTPRSVDHKNSGYSVIIPYDFIYTTIKQFK